MLVLQYILQDGAWRHGTYAVGTRQMLYKYMIIWKQYSHKPVRVNNSLQGMSPLGGSSDQAHAML